MILFYKILIFGLSILVLVTTAWWVAQIRRNRELKRVFTDKLIFPNEHSQFESVDGVNLHFISEGQGSNILLLHGIAANIYCWRFLIPMLAKHFRVLALDIKGFGLSDKPLNGDYGLKAQAALILKFLERKNIRQCTVIGNSMGGAIALEMALQRPDVAMDLVLINSVYDDALVQLDVRKLRMVAGLIAPLVTRSMVKQVVKRLYGKPLEVSEEVINAYFAPYLKDVASHKAFFSAVDALMDQDLLPRLKRLKKRILILWGKNDRLTPLKYGEGLYKALPVSSFLVHPTGGHHLQEEEPEWVAKHIENFLRPQV